MDFLVLDRFAKLFYTDTHVKKTNLQLASKLRWDSFIRYLEWLSKKNFVDAQINEGTEIYFLTENGFNMFCKLSEFLEYIK